MDFDEKIQTYEKSRLERVLKLVGIQLEAGRKSAGKLREEVITVQRSMWDNVNPTPGGDLDDLANIWQFQTEIEQEGRKAIFASLQVKRLERMLKNPYFGRIDFKEDGSEIADEIYIGISNLLDEKTCENLVYDWRAPVSSMFYDYETGAAGYFCPAGRIDGELTLKRQYKIWNGKLEYMFDCSLKIDDEILQEILSKNADSRMKTIVTSIQREQNRIIRDDTHKLLVVQGPAGSGKTSIALHRVAYLLYRYRKQVVADNIVIFSPNGIFNDYIADVLPELGEENMRRTTFMEFTRSMLGFDRKLEDMGGQMEYILSCHSHKACRARIEGIRYKASAAFSEILKKYVVYLIDTITFEDVEYNGIIIESKEEISDYFRNGLKFMPPMKRLEKIRNRLVSKLDPLIKERIEQVMPVLAETGEYVDEAEIRGRSAFIAREEFRPIREKITRMTEMEPVTCYTGLFSDRDLFDGMSDGRLPEFFEDIARYTIDEISYGRISFEDTAPLLLLTGMLAGVPNRRDIKHVIIDEAQDYTPVQFEVFRQLFGHCSLTMLGDMNQSINPYMNLGNYEVINRIFSFDTAVRLNLSKSYRSTRQITAFCRELLSEKDETEYMNREGELPRVFNTKNEMKMLRTVIEDIAVFEECGMKSVALICRTAGTCRKVFNQVSQSTDIRLVSTDCMKYSTGRVIIPSYLAKGLEFDAVLVICTDDDRYSDEEERRLFYTVCTRALHRLHIYCGNELPMFIRDIGGEFYEKAEV